MKTLWEKEKLLVTKHCGKRINCLLRSISPFHTVSSICLDNFLPFSSNFKLLSANSFSLEESKNLLSGDGLRVFEEYRSRFSLNVHSVSVHRPNSIFYGHQKVFTIGKLRSHSYQTNRMNVEHFPYLPIISKVLRTILYLYRYELQTYFRRIYHTYSVPHGYMLTLSQTTNFRLFQS